MNCKEIMIRGCRQVFYKIRFSDLKFIFLYFRTENKLMLSKINWENVPTEEVTPSMHRKMIWGEKIMVAKMKFKDGFVVPLHHHFHEQVTYCISGQMRFWFGENKEQVMDLFAGDVVVIPSDLPHEALMIGDVEEMDTWSPPRQDWIDKTDDYLRK